MCFSKNSSKDLEKSENPNFLYHYKSKIVEIHLFDTSFKCNY